MSVERKNTYISHNELCEMLDVSKNSALIADDMSLTWWPPASAWRLSMRVCSKEEIEKLAEEEIL